METDLDKKYKVALVCICTGMNYWPFAKGMLESARKFFLTKHDVDYFMWSDIPESTYGATVFDTEPTDWPFPTLMRYHLFLQQEEKLREYDYIFYCDADMIFVGEVGNEILGDGLTAAVHPMYALRKEYQLPFEPNEQSTAYFKSPKYYFAGGFQGGKSHDFIEAMKVMKKNISADFNINYMARWNDESHWNKYLFDHPPFVILSPSYIYPDSLIEEYYVKIWGCTYEPKIVTLTKKFTTSTEGGDAVRQFIASS